MVAQARLKPTQHQQHGAASKPNQKQVGPTSYVDIGAQAVTLYSDLPQTVNIAVLQVLANKPVHLFAMTPMATTMTAHGPMETATTQPTTG